MQEEWIDHKQVRVSETDTGVSRRIFTKIKKREAAGDIIRSELTNLRRQKRSVIKAFPLEREKKTDSIRDGACNLATHSFASTLRNFNWPRYKDTRSDDTPTQEELEVPRARAEIGGCCVEYRSEVRDCGLTRTAGITYYETSFCIDLRNNRQTSRPSSSVLRYRADWRRL